MLFQQGQTYTFYLESSWSDINNTAVLRLSGGGLAYAPIQGNADAVALRALQALGFQVSTFSVRPPDVPGQRLYACIATWAAPSKNIPTGYGCSTAPSSSSYYTVSSWPCGIALFSVQEYYAGVARPTPPPRQTTNSSFPTPQAGQPSPGPGYRGSYEPPVWVEHQQPVFFSGLGAIVATPSSVHARIVTLDSTWSQLENAAGQCPGNNTIAQFNVLQAFQTDLNAWRQFVQQGVTLLNAQEADTTVDSFQAKAAAWPAKLSQAGCSVSNVVQPPPDPLAAAAAAAKQSAATLATGLEWLAGVILVVGVAAVVVPIVRDSGKQKKAA